MHTYMLHEQMHTQYVYTHRVSFSRELVNANIYISFYSSKSK